MTVDVDDGAKLGKTRMAYVTDTRDENAVPVTTVFAEKNVKTWKPSAARAGGGIKRIAANNINLMVLSIRGY